MSANLRLEENFLELVKDLFISDVKVSAEHSDEIFKIFDDILCWEEKLFIINIITFSTSAFVISLKLNKF